MSKAVVLLGTNLNDRQENLRIAGIKLSERIGQQLFSSSVYSTAPWGNVEQDDFLNMIMVFETALSPEKLMEELLSIEHEMGRVRTSKWSPRLIDLDIIYYDDLVIHKPGLQIPHPYLQDRRFTLIPLVEIMPDFIHPVFNLTNTELLARTTDNSEVFLLSNGK